MEEEEEEDEVWSWGAGTEGQLGTLKAKDEVLPLFIPSLSSSSSPPFSFFSCGGAHVIAVTAGGSVLTWGRGTSGQLGHGDILNSLQPKPLLSLQTFFIINASAGWNHSAFVSDSGSLFTCGDGSFGQLGHGNSVSLSSPLKISYFDSRQVQQIACGMRHSVALLKGSSGDQVYGFGFAKRGQLGISSHKIKSVNLPQLTVGFEDVDVVRVNANGDHSAALSGEGHLYTWGRGFSGSSDEYQPRCAVESLQITEVALGWNHALALTGNGEVFMIGGNHHGILANSTKTNPASHMLQNSAKSNETLTYRVPGLDQIKVLQIDAGAEHSALITEDGSIMTWGWGEHGQLGLGNTEDQSSPQVVSVGHRLAKEYTNSKVYCGSGFTYALRTLRHSSPT